MSNSTELSSRSGRYIRQLTGYRAFIPAPLPPDPPLRLQGELQTLLSRADRALGRLDGSIHTLPNPDLRSEKTGCAFVTAICHAFWFNASLAFVRVDQLVNIFFGYWLVRLVSSLMLMQLKPVKLPTNWLLGSVSKRLQTR